MEDLSGAAGLGLAWIYSLLASATVALANFIEIIPWQSVKILLLPILLILEAMAKFAYGLVPSTVVTFEQQQQKDQEMKAACLSFVENTQDAWNNLGNNSASKQSYLRATFFEEIKTILNISVTIDFYTSSTDGITGQYSHYGTTIDGKIFPSKTLIINSYYINETAAEKDIRLTIIHESRHAYQHEAVDETNDHIVCEETIGYWQQNFAPGEYEEPSLNDAVQNARYVSQPVEYDAFMFTGQFPEALVLAFQMGWDIYRGSWQPRT